MKNRILCSCLNDNMDSVLISKDGGYHWQLVRCTHCDGSSVTIPYGNGLYVTFKK